jgi:hypothetical protein
LLKVKAVVIIPYETHLHIYEKLGEKCHKMEVKLPITMKTNSNDWLIFISAHNLSCKQMNYVVEGRVDVGSLHESIESKILSKFLFIGSLCMELNS